MTRLGRLEFALVVIFGVALVASLGIILHLSRRLAALQRQHAADLQSLRELHAALRQPELPQAPAQTESPAPPGAYLATIAKRDATIERLNQELSEARANIQDLQAQLSSSNDEHEKALAGANERHQKEQEDWQSQLDALKQELDSAQAELQGFPPTPRQCGSGQRQVEERYQRGLRSRCRLRAPGSPTARPG